jgi:hypothetical protein
LGTDAAFLGILITNGWADCNNNTIGSLDGTKTILITNSYTSSSSAYGIYSSVSISAVTNFKGNAIGAVTHAKTGTSACGLIGLRAGNNSGNNLIIEDNVIGNSSAELKTINTSTVTSQEGNSVIGIYVAGSILTIKNNLIRNLTTNSQSAGTGTSGSIHGILITGAASGSLVSGNTIHSLSNTSPAANSWVNGVSISTSTSLLTV